MDIKCQMVEYTATVSLKEYIEECVDVEQFLGYCRNCSNYGRVWSCPEFDFDPMDYWRRYDSLYILGRKLILPEELRLRIYSEEEREKVLTDLLKEPKMQLDRDLLSMEQSRPGSRALSGGSCLYCQTGDCARIHGKPCRFPDQMRYSIEALGGNVGRTLSKYLHLKLLWMEKGRLPAYFIIVGGLLHQKWLPR